MAISKIISSSISDNTVVAADVGPNAITASELADDAVDTAAIVNDAVTGAKIENNPTIAGNLSVGGTAAVTGTSTFTGASTFSGGIANSGTISAGTIGSAMALPSFVGMIASFGTATAPTGWLICDGSAISRSTYSVLFGVISTTWGAGDGSSTFNIPDLRGQFLRGFDNGAGNDPDAGSRTGGDAVGSSQGDSVKSHSHGIESLNPHTGSSGAGNRPVAGNNGYPQNGVGSTAHVFNFAQVNRAIPYGFLNTYSVGGEGRPKNKYVQYMIKI